MNMRRKRALEKPGNEHEFWREFYAGAQAATNDFTRAFSTREASNFSVGE